MGLSASVMCRCLQDGLPVPDKYGKIVLGEDGYPSPDLEYEGNEDVHVGFARWSGTCCPHPDMELVERRIGTWSAVGALTRTLRDHNTKGRFDTLLAELPEANGGMTRSETALRMRDELHRFLELEEPGLKGVLVDSERDEIVWHCAPRTRNEVVVSWRERIRLGIDDEGFYVRSSDGGVLFRARFFSQHVAGPHAGDAREDEGVRFRDDESGLEFLCRSAVRSRQIPWDDGSGRNADGRLRFVYPNRLHFEHRSAVSVDHGFTVASLLAVCEGAVATGNPIRWT